MFPSGYCIQSYLTEGRLTLIAAECRELDSMIDRVSDEVHQALAEHVLPTAIQQSLAAQRHEADRFARFHRSVPHHTLHPLEQLLRRNPKQRVKELVEFVQLH